MSLNDEKLFGTTERHLKEVIPKPLFLRNRLISFKTFSHISFPASNWTFFVLS